MRCLRNESTFTHPREAAFIPASSDKRVRRRLIRGDNQDIKRALRALASRAADEVGRARPRVYGERRSAEGKTKPKILRCLELYIAR